MLTLEDCKVIQNKLFIWGVEVWAYGTEPKRLVHGTHPTKAWGNLNAIERQTDTYNTNGEYVLQITSYINDGKVIDIVGVCPECRFYYTIYPVSDCSSCAEEGQWRGL